MINMCEFIKDLDRKTERNGLRYSGFAYPRQTGAAQAPTEKTQPTLPYSAQCYKAHPLFRG